MNDHAELLQSVVVQIATPYSVGTGFFLPDTDTIVTAEHIIRDNREVVIELQDQQKFIAAVLYQDPLLDLAFLDGSAIKAPIDNLWSFGDADASDGMPIVAIGNGISRGGVSIQPGTILDSNYHSHGINCVLHNADLNPIQTGSPLVSAHFQLMGMNTFMGVDEGVLSYALPIQLIQDAWQAYAPSFGKIGGKCENCNEVVFATDLIKKHECPNCQQTLILPAFLPDYEPSGIAQTIETMIGQAGHEVVYSRRGPNNWEILEGSAAINISYHERSGLITGDAYLCELPSHNLKPIYEFLLRLNHEVEGLAFSVKDNDVLLSLLIYDHYLDADVGLALFKDLFIKADYYDNILVEEFGGQWKEAPI